MTLVRAESWWNSVADMPGESDKLLSAPSPSRMLNICRELAPVLFTNLNFNQPEDKFWGQASSIISKITKISPVPDPTVDFKLFVLSLYTFRDLLKPASVDSCLVYVREFCPDPPAHFFVNEFLCAVCDPAVAIATYYEMDQIQLPQWVQWKSEKGNMERFFDLFVTMIQPGEEHFELVRRLIELLAAMVRTNMDLVTWEKLAVNLYKAIIGVLEGIRDERSVSVARCLIDVVDPLVTKSPHQMEAFILKAKCLLAEGSMFRDYLLYWLCQKASPFTEAILVMNLTRSALYSNFVFEMIEKIAPSLSFSNVSSLISHLAKAMIQKQVWMRLAAKALVHVFTTCKITDSHKRWFKEYVKACFMFVRLAFETNKAKDRVTAWVSVACASFGSIDWIKEEIAVNMMLAVKPETKFLLCLFDGEKREVVDRAEWDEEYSMFSKYADQYENLPFKKQLPRLVKLKDKVNKLDALDPEVEKLDVSPQLKQFIMVRPNVDGDITKVIYSLEDAIDAERERMADVLRLEKEMESPTVDVTMYDLHPPRRILPWVQGTLFCARKYTKQILAYQKKTIEEQMAILDGFIELVKQNPELKFRRARLLKFFDSQLFNDQYVIKRQSIRALFGFHVTAIEQAYVDPLKNVTVRQELRQALLSLDQQCEYSPPSTLEDVLIDRMPKWFDERVLEGALTVMSQPVCLPTIATIQGIAETIAKRVKATLSSKVMTILFNGVMRCMFEQEYLTRQSLLYGWDEEDVGFLERCHRLSGKRVVSLKLTRSVFGEDRAQAVLRTVVKTKGDVFATIPFMTNPLDITYEISCVVKLLRYIYGVNEEISGDDLVKVLYATIVTSPPTNCLRVYRFLKKWNMVVSAPLMRDAMDTFLAAVEMVMEADV